MSGEEFLKSSSKWHGVNVSVSFSVLWEKNRNFNCGHCGVDGCPILNFIFKTFLFSLIFSRVIYQQNFDNTKVPQWLGGSTICKFFCVKISVPPRAVVPDTNFVQNDTVYTSPRHQLDPCSQCVRVRLDGTDTSLRAGWVATAGIVNTQGEKEQRENTGYARTHTFPKTEKKMSGRSLPPVPPPAASRKPLPSPPSSSQQDTVGAASPRVKPCSVCGNTNKTGARNCHYCGLSLLSNLSISTAGATNSHPSVSGPERSRCRRFIVRSGLFYTLSLCLDLRSLSLSLSLSLSCMPYPFFFVIQNCVVALWLLYFSFSNNGIATLIINQCKIVFAPSEPPLFCIIFLGYVHSVSWICAFYILDISSY